MKKIILSLILISCFLTLNSYAVTRVISVQNFSFSPTPLSATVGDTIKWQWISGSHTTTSTNIPLAASSWDSPLNSSSTTFIYVLLIPGTYNYKCTPHESMGMTGIINAQPNSINQIESVVNSFELKQNYPNPFNPVTKINFSIPKSGFVKINIYDETGKLIKSIVNETLNQGLYSVDFDGSNLSSGIYFYKMETTDFTDIKKMVLLK